MSYLDDIVTKGRSRPSGGKDGFLKKETAKRQSVKNRLKLRYEMWYLFHNRPSVSANCLDLLCDNTRLDILCATFGYYCSLIK